MGSMRVDRKITIDFLQITINVILTKPGGITAARNELRKHYPDFPEFEAGPTTGALHSAKYESYPGQHWIFLERRTMIGSIAHELEHALDIIEDWYDIHDGEFRAYLLDYFINKITGDRYIVLK